MATLLLRLSGPMQAWGVQSRFGVRDTGREPTKSGVIGLVCAALGRPRDAEIADLAALRYGVRVDKEGLMQRDYQTAGKGGYLKANGSVQRKTLIVSTRYYLADARFLAALEGDEGLLRQVHAALRDPHWPLCLGRKAFPPGEPVWLKDGLIEAPLRKALASYPWLGTTLGSDDAPPAQLRLVLPDATGPLVRNDQPFSFSERRFAPRRVRIDYVPTPPPDPEEAPCTYQN